MKHPFNYSWFLKLTRALSVYHSYVRRLNAIAVEGKVPHKKRIQDINMLLIQFSQALLEAEREFLDLTQFPAPLTNKRCAPREQHHAMGLSFTIYLN